ncbi:hypothetical protein HAX54_045595 [Datura stramonium]|uniref:Storage protein n=1 Tax=Datura stramonium TaxID=4076 RepID=A0ABS8WG42_DATST|nr:hypothetical protein [Datura stramonium]
MGTLYRSGALRRSNDRSRLIITTMMGMVLGYFLGISSPYVSLTKISLPSNLISSLAFGDDHRRPSIERFFPDNLVTPQNVPYLVSRQSAMFCAFVMPVLDLIHVPTNPRGAESLPPMIVVPESDFYLRRLWGEPSKDLTMKPKYLVTFTVGLNQKDNIDAAVKKFSEDFQILLFHYDGRTSEWDEFEWSKRAVHISIRKQTKWWYAKRFLHPDVVASYDYIFIWDEDLGVENFNAEKYIRLVKRHGLEISQPGLEPNSGLTWQMTKRRNDREVHKNTDERPGWCSNPRLPPCAAFVEIMAPVFSREAWRCVWHMIQVVLTPGSDASTWNNDLVHGWGLDFALRRCVEPAHEKIGVVDSQWIEHQFVPSLGSQALPSLQNAIVLTGMPRLLLGETENGKAPWEGAADQVLNGVWTAIRNIAPWDAVRR